MLPSSLTAKFCLRCQPELQCTSILFYMVFQQDYINSGLIWIKQVCRQGSVNGNRRRPSKVKFFFFIHFRNAHRVLPKFPVATKTNYLNLLKAKGIKWRIYSQIFEGWGGLWLLTFNCIYYLRQNLVCNNFFSGI